jgi:hypothetical protein
MRRGNPPWRSAGRQHRFQVTTHAEWRDAACKAGGIIGFNE